MTNPILITQGVAQAGGYLTGGMTHHVKRIDITAAPTGAEQDTLFDLPAKAILTDMFVNVKTAEATGTTKTMNIGLLASQSGGNASGFAIALDVSATGLKRPGVTITVGNTETYVSAFTRGAFLTSGTPLAGINTATHEGSYYEKPFLTDSVTAKRLTFTAGSNDWVEFRGSIYLAYDTVE